MYLFYFHNILCSLKNVAYFVELMFQWNEYWVLWLNKDLVKNKWQILKTRNTISSLTEFIFLKIVLSFVWIFKKTWNIYI